MVLDVEGFLENVRSARELFRDTVVDHGEPQAFKAFSQIRLIPTQSHRVQKRIAFLAQYLPILFWHGHFVMDARQKLVPVPTPHRASFNQVGLVLRIMGARLA